MESSDVADRPEDDKLKKLAEIAADIFRGLSPTPEVTKDRSIDTSQSSGLYTPLQEGQIRLISIIPSVDFEAPLICTLRPVSLTQARYSAISYVWGDSSNPEEASINGHIVLLQHNLASALRHIRATGASEVCSALWADAICINQHDIPEKNQQVGMMDRIIQEVVLSKELIFMSGEQVITARQLRKVHETLKSIEKPPLDFLSQLTERWPNFGWLLLDNLLSLKNLMMRGFTDGHNTINIFSGLLLVTARNRVSNPRDKVYALLGMTGLQDTIRPDYSIPVTSLYISTCDLLLKNKADLSFLAMGRLSTLDHNLAVDSQMPSWLPNFHAVSQCTDKLPSLRQFVGRAYEAATSLSGEPQILASSSGSYLAVDGYVIDTVEAVLTATGHSPIQDIMEHVLFICDSLKESVFPVLQAACRTLTGDFDTMGSSRIRKLDDKAYIALGVTFLRMLEVWYEQYSDNDERTVTMEHRQKFIAYFNSLCPDPSHSENLTEVVREHFLGSASELGHWTSERICRVFYKLPDMYSRSSQAFQMINFVWSTMQARSTIRSSKGHFGNAPLDTKVGDQICIFKGCRFPVILRKQPQYVYVGPCFLLGFMDGEIVDMAERGEVQEERFEIF
ncbi:uncharacterized protein N0V89_011458 [Didymosphaeria variabile]|uniref:Heterokaryon incompatibility domain-containing protein n=1 Tax=Didymosphaeria variabile TaxID=1932322 RepID=A0A9W8XBB6_9PLEO|nr:uncharacterized protein N0V89_011458 [Didymosphaeria variabile]KAJ4345328.1 hypothetical protein N0V89_011458 [Didymosphaeria variabile]